MGSLQPHYTAKSPQSLPQPLSIWAVFVANLGYRYREWLGKSRYDYIDYTWEQLGALPFHD
jgi:hypothetical protein